MGCATVFDGSAPFLCALVLQRIPPLPTNVFTLLTHQAARGASFRADLRVSRAAFARFALTYA